MLLVAGPCALENEELCLNVADALVKLQSEHNELQIIFKGSFDKANRSSLKSPRGPGLEEGLRILGLVRETFGFPVVTDIHLPEQAVAVAEVCDILQIPAFLCRQTDLLISAARTSRVVMVKKGQFLSPVEMRYVIEKLEGVDAEEVWITERGTTFGYQNLVVDMRNMEILKTYGHPLIFDATHSVQLPGAGDGTTVGQREFVPVLARAAVAAGADGLFVETHTNPDEAISDGPNQVPLAQLHSIVEETLSHWKLRRQYAG